MTSKKESNEMFFVSLISTITNGILGLLRNNFDVQLFCHPMSISSKLATFYAKYRVVGF